MARKKHSELAAGIFVLAALAVLVGVIVWLGGAEIFLPTKQKAVFFVKEQTGSVGLEAGGFVQIGDDQVGRIADIHFNPESGRTYYSAEIERGDFKIYADGEARVVAGLIGGARLIIINRGTEKKPLADANNPIELQGGLDQVMSDLASASHKVNQIADVIRKELNLEDPEAVLKKVHVVIDSLKSAAADVAKIAASIHLETDSENPEAVLAKVHRSVDDINKMTADARPKISDTLSAFRKYTKEDVAEILTKLRQANTELLKIAKDFSTVSQQAKEIVLLHRDNIDEMIDNMTQVSANLKAASKEIRRNPWKLLHKPDEKELRSQNIHDAARAFSNGAEQLDQALAKMTGLAKASPKGIPADDATLQKVRKQLEEAFAKFTKAEQALWKELSR